MEDLGMETIDLEGAGNGGLLKLCKQEEITFQECFSSQGFFSAFITDGMVDVKNKVNLDTLDDGLTIKEWFSIAKNYHIESSLHEVSLRKIEVAIIRMLLPLTMDHNFFSNPSNVLDLEEIGLSQNELLELYEMLGDNQRIKRCAKHGWMCRGEFWCESPTSEVMSIIANTLHASSFLTDTAAGRNILKESVNFRDSAVTRSISVYGWGP
jgi:hypothetical protein